MLSRLDSGFASHELFTRAFRRRFGCTPAAHRARALTSATPAERRRHRTAVASSAPCIRLYRMSTAEPALRRFPMPMLSIETRTITPQPVLFVRLSTSRQELP
jgi:AraC family transcriptional regulator